MIINIYQLDRWFFCDDKVVSSYVPSKELKRINLLLVLSTKVKVGGCKQANTDIISKM